MTDSSEYSNPYLAASLLPPGRDYLEATRDFLKEEQQRLYERLVSIEDDDGSIPDDAVDEWSMVKGRFDQTRLFYGLVIQSLHSKSVEESDDA